MELPSSGYALAQLPNSRIRRFWPGLRADAEDLLENAHTAESGTARQRSAQMMRRIQAHWLFPGSPLGNRFAASSPPSTSSVVPVM